MTRRQDGWSSSTYSTHASFVYSNQYTTPVVDLLDPQFGEDILDLGCGHGELTLEGLLPRVVFERHPCRSDPTTCPPPPPPSSTTTVDSFSTDAKEEGGRRTGSIVGLDSSRTLLDTARERTSDALLKAAQLQATSSDRPSVHVDHHQVEWVERDGHDLSEWYRTISSTRTEPGQDQGGRGGGGRGTGIAWERERSSTILDRVTKEGGFDAVFSNAALHWMKRDPARVVRGVWDVLKSGARFVGEFGGFLNMIGVRSALHSALSRRGIDPNEVDPWFFPTERHYRALLETQGFVVESCELVPRMTPLPTGLEGWLETFAFAFLDAVGSSPTADRSSSASTTTSDRGDRDVRSEVIREVCDACQVDMRDPVSGKWRVMYVRLRFKATKPRAT
ncbi:hypothetical protein JCM10212_001116 [Sporobolomyces blumeae]